MALGPDLGEKCGATPSLASLLRVGAPSRRSAARIKQILVLASIPMFIFMGSILERFGSAMDMLKATEVLLKRVPGALAVAVMVMGTILAAPIGVVGAAVVTLSVIALPQMLASGYDKRLAVGTIASAGTLGIICGAPWITKARSSRCLPRSGEIAGLH